MELQNFIVLYRPPDWWNLAEHPLAFKCMAEDTDHAEEQLLNANPYATISWTVITDSVDDALEDYYHTWEDSSGD